MEEVTIVVLAPFAFINGEEEVDVFVLEGIVFDVGFRMRHFIGVFFDGVVELVGFIVGEGFQELANKGPLQGVGVYVYQRELGIVPDTRCMEEEFFQAASL